MIPNKEKILSLLQAKGLQYQLYEHPPIFTVEEAAKYCAHIPPAHVKNLFVRNKKKTAYWLITVKEEKRVDLLALGDLLKTGRLSFASHHDLVAMLGVQPGSVTPLAIINDQVKRVKLAFDKDLLSEEYISVHPLENTATISVKLTEMLDFIAAYYPEKIEFMPIPLITNEKRI